MTQRFVKFVLDAQSLDVTVIRMEGKGIDEYMQSLLETEILGSVEDRKKFAESIKNKKRPDFLTLTRGEDGFFDFTEGFNS